MHASGIREDEGVVRRQGASKGHACVRCCEVVQAVPELVTGTVGCLLGVETSPQEPAPKLHGVQCRHADKVPDVVVDVRPWCGQKPKLGARDRMLQCRAELRADGLGHLTVPQSVQTAVRARRRTATRAAPL